ncbi:MAG: hypothetical protein P1V81_14570 [Planctomycetota bacterium]|nr:hypothetical protein [Planctomycetota bacterium]
MSEPHDRGAPAGCESPGLGPQAEVWADLARLLERAEATYPPPLGPGRARALQVRLILTRLLLACLPLLLGIGTLVLAILLLVSDHEPGPRNLAAMLLGGFLVLVALVSLQSWATAATRGADQLQHRPGLVGTLTSALGLVAKALTLLLTPFLLTLLFAGLSSKAEDEEQPEPQEPAPAPDPHGEPQLFAYEPDDSPALQHLLALVAEALDVPPWRTVWGGARTYASRPGQGGTEDLELPLLDLQALSPRELLALVLTASWYRADPTHHQLRHALRIQSRLAAIAAHHRSAKLWVLDLSAHVAALAHRLNHAACQRELRRQRAAGARHTARIVGGPTTASALRANLLGGLWSKHIEPAVLTAEGPPFHALHTHEQLGPPPEVLAELERLLADPPTGDLPSDALLDELEALPEPGPLELPRMAWDLLFEDRDTHRAWLLDVDRRWRVAAAAHHVGLRVLPLADAPYRPPTLELPAHGGLVRSVAALGSYPLTLVLVLYGLFQLQGTPALGVGAIAAGAASLFLTLHLQRSMLLDSGGVEQVGPLTGWRSSWLSVRELSLGKRRLELGCADVEGRTKRLSVVATRAQRYEAADLALELAPNLATLAWCTGLARVAAPSPERLAAEAPEVLRCEPDGVQLRSASGAQLVFGPDHPDLALIERSVRARVLGRT